jgi:hypothetical protein
LLAIASVYLLWKQPATRGAGRTILILYTVGMLVLNTIFFVSLVMSTIFSLTIMKMEDPGNHWLRYIGLLRAPPILLNDMLFVTGGRLILGCSSLIP